MSILVAASTDRISRSANLPASNAMTMAAHIRVLARTGNLQETLVINRQAGGLLTSQGYDTSFGAGLKQRLTWAGNDGNFSNEIPLDTWVYVAITASGTAVGNVIGYWGLSAGGTLGNSVNNSTTSSAYTSGGMAFASHPVNNGEQSNARVAYGRVWDAALTITELQAEMVSATPVRTANLNTAFTGVGGSGADVSGNGRNWTLTGTSASTDDPFGVGAASNAPIARRIYVMP